MATYTIGGAWRFAYALSGGQQQFPTLTQNVNFGWNADRFTAIKLSGYTMQWTRASTGVDVTMFNGVWSYTSGYNMDVVFDDDQTVEGDFLYWMISATSKQGDYTAAYTVTFDANGGQPTPEPITAVDVLPELPTDITRDGYYLAGWSYTRDFLSRANPGDIIASDTTLYAWWQSQTHVVIYDDSGIYRYFDGDIAGPRTITTVSDGDTRTLTVYNSGDTRIITYDAYTLEGRTFAGWSYNLGGQVDIPANAVSVPVTAGTDLVLWEVYTETADIDPTITLQLYKQTSEPNRLDKSAYMSLVSTMTGALRADCDIVSPSIVVNDTSVPSYNYAYIPSLSRYYYIDSITSIARNMWRLDMRADVLMSWASQIRKMRGVVSRNEYEYDIGLRDNMTVTDSTATVTALSASTSPFDRAHIGVLDYNIVLVVQQNHY